MKHRHTAESDVNVNVELPTEDLKELVETVGDVAIKVIAVYMISDTIRHFLKS
jgi:hypothetical protein